MKKLALTTLILLAFFLPAKAGAVAVSDRATLNIDEKLADTTSVQYLEPKKILIARVTTKSDELANDPQLWIKSLYYYSITRLQFADLPYNYLVTRDGQVYKAKAGYDGAVPELQTPEGVILVGYLSNGTDVPTLAQQSMAQLVTQLSAQFAIKRENVQPVNLTVARKTDEKQLTKLKYVLSVETYMNQSLALARYSATGTPQSYTAEVKVDSMPTELKANEKGSVKLTITNKNEFPWFTDTKFLYVTTADGAKSSMVVNGVWDSFVKPTHVEGKTVLPGESVEVSFEVKAGLLPVANETDQFKLVMDPNTAVADSEFTINYKILKGDFELVRVIPKDYPFTYLRSCASFSCAEVVRAEKGAIFPVVEVQGAWTKVTMDDGNQAWLYTAYAKAIKQ